MEFAINTEYLRKVRGNRPERTDIEAARIAKSAGFSIIDCTPAFSYDKDYEKNAHKLAEDLASEGLRVEQSHAPFNIHYKLPLDEFKRWMWQCFDIARILGTKYVVVHPNESSDGNIYTKEAADFMYELFMPYVEYGAKHGIGIAIENIDTPPSFHIELVDRFNTDTVTACWDFGHANCYVKDPLKELKALGSRLSCTHVHDNNGSDSHLPIYFGTADWESIAKYLKESYSGVFTFEFVYGCIPDDLLIDYLKLEIKSAERLFEQA